MADLLRSGHTMLNIACSVCNNPIFRNKEGLKFCPTCNREVHIIDEKTAQNYKQNESYNQFKKLNKYQIGIKNLDPIREVIINKMQWITEKLDQETEIVLLEKYTQILLNLFDILKKISSL